MYANVNKNRGASLSIAERASGAYGMSAHGRQSTDTRSPSISAGRSSTLGESARREHCACLLRVRVVLGSSMAARDRSRKLVAALRAQHAVQAQLIDLLDELGGDGDRLPPAGATPNPAPGKEPVVCRDPQAPPESSGQPGSISESGGESPSSPSVDAKVDELFRTLETKQQQSPSRKERGAA